MRVKSLGNGKKRRHIFNFTHFDIGFPSLWDIFFKSVQVCIWFALSKIRNFYLISGMVTRVHLIHKLLFEVAR